MRTMSRLASDHFDGIYSNFSTHIDRCHLRARKYSVSVTCCHPVISRHRFSVVHGLCHKGTDTSTAAPYCSFLPCHSYYRHWDQREVAALKCQQNCDT